MPVDTDVISRACPCGNGQVETMISTPDRTSINSYSVRRSHRINCTECDRQYVIDGTSIVRRDALLAYRSVNERWSTGFNELNGSPEALEIRAALAAALATFRTKSAAYNFLTRGGVTGDTYSSFIRDYPGANEFATGVHPLDIPKVLRLLGRESGWFEKRLEELAAIRQSTPSVQSVMEL
jgi:hypothetical protein